MILFGVTDEHCIGCGAPGDQLPLCDDCLVRWTSTDPDQPQQEAA